MDSWCWPIVSQHVSLCGTSWHVRMCRRELKSVFFECGMPAEILKDNAPDFCSHTFLTLTDEWGIRMRYQSAYVPEGNSIVEQCHHTVKRIAMRSSIAEAVYWYNAIPKDNETMSSAPVNGMDPKLSPPEVRSNAYHRTANAPLDFAKDSLMSWSVLRQCCSIAHPAMWKTFANAMNQPLQRKMKVTHHPVAR